MLCRCFQAGLLHKGIKHLTSYHALFYGHLHKNAEQAQLISILVQCGKKKIDLCVKQGWKLWLNTDNQ